MNKNTRIVLSILGVFILTLGILSLKEDEKRFEVSKGLNIFATLFRDVNLFYVDEIEPEKLVQTGIDAMLSLWILIRSIIRNRKWMSSR